MSSPIISFSHQILLFLTQHVAQFLPPDFQVDHISHAEFGHSAHDVFREQFLIQLVLEFRAQVFVSLYFRLSLQLFLVSSGFVLYPDEGGGGRGRVERWWSP